MRKTAVVKICIMVLLLVGLWIGLTRTDLFKSSETVIRWAPLGDTAEKAETDHGGKRQK
ncbi:MAG: hypothetical protein R6V10_13255 [bacterium]